MEEGKVFHVTSVTCSRSFTGHDKQRPTVKQRKAADDEPVKYSEQDNTKSSKAQVVKVRRPRRHTTGGGSQHKEAIKRAKDMVANDPSIDTKAHDSSHGSLNRKELISMLKDRYGSDMEKYRSLKKNEKTEDVEHRTVESNTLQRPKKSGKILTYKTSSELNGHARRGSTSSQEGSQTSQESFAYSATPPSVDSHSTKAMQTAALRQYAQRNRKLSNGSSVQSEYSSSSDMHQAVPRMKEKSHHVVTTTTTTQYQHQERKPALAQSNREQQVLMSERQATAQHQQQQQLEETDGQRSHVLYLQYNDEIKRVNMPSVISSLDTLKALFVTSFPGKLSMIRLDERGLIYIKDKEADLFYELEDIRDVQPRSHVQLRERSASFESMSSSHTDMSGYDSRRYMAAMNNNMPYSTSTLPARMHQNNNGHYAESLQDFEVRPRSGSGSSLRSDSVLTKPTWQHHDNYHYQQQQQHSREPISSWNNKGMLSPKSPKRETQTMRTEMTTTYQPVGAHEIGKPFAPLTEAPKLKTRKPSEKDKKGPSVEEQLTDLTRLLHNALNSDEEDAVGQMGQPAPGKLDQQLVDNLEALAEFNYSKSPTKSRHFTPTVFTAAKKRQVEGSPEDGNYFNYNSGDAVYTKSTLSPRGPMSQSSVDDPDKGYMHDGPDIYMRSGSNSSLNYEAGVADSLLQSLRADRVDEELTKTGPPQTKIKSKTATTIRITAGSSQDKSKDIHYQQDTTKKGKTFLQFHFTA
eukprot:gene3253-3734_t